MINSSQMLTATAGQLHSMLVLIVGSEPDITDQIQAWGSIGAVAAALFALLVQEIVRRHAEDKRRRELAKAAADIAREASRLVAERLHWALKSQDGPTLFELRGHRTTEMVQAMRELDISSLSPALIAPFARVRSDVYAVNERISDVFESENRGPAKQKVALRARRTHRLTSAGRVLGAALEQYNQYRAALEVTFKEGSIAVALESDVSDFIRECQRQTSSALEAHD